MYFKLIDCYAKYNNSHAKHDDSVDENELDFLLYLTGSFIRFLIKINKKKCDCSRQLGGNRLWITRCHSILMISLEIM